MAILISREEWQRSVEAQIGPEEMVTCPYCKGEGITYEDECDCPNCEGHEFDCTACDELDDHKVAYWELPLDVRDEIYSRVKYYRAAYNDVKALEEWTGKPGVVQEHGFIPYTPLRRKQAGGYFQCEPLVRTESGFEFSLKEDA